MSALTCMLLLCVVDCWIEVHALPVGTRGDPEFQLLGYDCNEDTPISTISLRDVGSCSHLVPKNLTTKSFPGQVIQTVKYNALPVLTCRATRSIFVTHCGMHSHSSFVVTPVITQPVEIDDDTCRALHKDPSACWEGHSICGMEKNKENRWVIAMAGTTSGVSSCKGGEYTHPANRKRYHDVVAREEWTLLLSESTGHLNIETGNLRIKSKIDCEVGINHCYDAIIGTSVWYPPESLCANKYEILYDGMIHRSFETESAFPQIFWVREYASTSDLFYIHGDLLSSTQVCGAQGYTTSYPSIMILPGRRMASKTGRRKLPANYKMTTYFNAKVTSINVELRGQIERAWLDNLKATCEVERRLLMTQLEVIRSHPHSGSLITTKKTGIFARRAGEAVHVMQCAPRVVKLRSHTICYELLPVTYKDEDHFLHPLTRILANTSSPTVCSKLSPILYEYADGWIKQTPNGFDIAKSPQVLKPKTDMAFDFAPRLHTERGGLYSDKDLEDLNDFIMFPDVREKVVSDVTRGLTGRTIISRKYDFSHVADYSSIREEAEKAARGVMHDFFGIIYDFGQYVSGVIGIYVVYKAIIFVCSHVVRLFSLYRVVGCSFRLGACIADSFTTCVLSAFNLQHEHAQSRASDAEVEEVIPLTADPHEDPILVQPENATAPPEVYPDLKRY